MLPNLLDHLSEALQVVRRSRLGLVVDFDGTIAELAKTPDYVEVSCRCAELLERLSNAVAMVAVASGRAAYDLKGKVGLNGVVYVGNHGAEYLIDGIRTVAPGAIEYRCKVKTVLDYLRATVLVPDLFWQDKELSASVHYRNTLDPIQTGRMLASALKSAPGAEDLEIFWGKLVLEMRAPIGLNKGFAIRKLVRDHQLNAVLFMGDDTTDVDGLRTVKELESEYGMSAMGIAVMHEDSPKALLALADFGLNGVSEVAIFLEWLDAALS